LAHPAAIDRDPPRRAREHEADVIVQIKSASPALTMSAVQAPSCRAISHLLRAHADAGVGHRERDPGAAVLLSLPSGDGDGVLLGELVGVARQIKQGLPETSLVGVDRAKVCWVVDDEAIAVLRRQVIDGQLSPAPPGDR
jgi:hypothetical protein